MLFLPRYRLLRALALLLLMLGAPGLASAESKTGPLTLTITQAGKASLAGDTQFMVELRNDGLLALPLPTRPGWDTEGGLELRVTPVANAAATRTVPAQPDPARNGRLAANRRGVALPAGEALGLYRTVKTSELFSAAGEYDVVVIYRGLRAGEVASAPLRVTVTP